MSTKHHSVIRTIYLYLFTLIGLVLIVTSAVDFIDMALKAFVFTQAEKSEYLWEKQPPVVPRSIAEIESGESVANKQLTEDQLTDIAAWLEDYNSWKERQDEYDPVRSRREQDAARNIAMLLVGIPLYAYHWSIIKKETKKA